MTSLKLAPTFLIQIGTNYPNIQPRDCHFTPSLAQGQVPSLEQIMLCEDFNIDKLLLHWLSVKHISYFFSCFYLLQIDHFGFLEDGTFKQRYLVNDKHWQQPGGPILFYTGNEGDITWFCNNTVNIPSVTLYSHTHNPQSNSTLVFSVGLHVGNCGGVGRHAGFCRTSLLWRITAIWTRLVQCK